ncbi:uncharacterized protein LOC129218781 [Uloborus diversus]|uniref:uncharacterized protein LOC129218781 n=1 Tax=Uloborus diversus TaxID=327109 RepID=UPI00240A9A41|nr:uncharacterized protein LOC129218781 [Uloborus diversus]
MIVAVLYIVLATLKGKAKPIHAFCSLESLEILCSSEKIFLDGTFKLAPKLFCQLYTLHGSFKGKIFPLVYSFLPNKTKATYLTLFKNLKIQAEKFGFKFQPPSAMLDFEAGAINALEEVFPFINVKGCYFHYSQAIWRKVQELGLVKNYVNSEETRTWIRRIIALPLVPMDEVSEAFLLLLEDAPQQTRAVRKMIDYVVDTWLDENNATFQMDSWNHFETNDNLRTNNNVEGWHSKLSKRGLPPHPNIFSLVKVLQDIEAENEAERRTLRSRKQKSTQKKQYRVLNERLALLKQRLIDNNIQLKAYMDAVAYLASTKK